MLGNISMVSLRCFIAVELMPGLCRTLSTLSRELKKDDVIQVSEQNIHITLKFLGDVSPDKLSSVESRLREVKFKPFRLAVKGVGVFPNENYARVVWTGCESKELAALANSVNKALDGVFKPEVFTAHITFARVKRKTELKPFLEKYKRWVFDEFKINKFVLKSSELTSGGPVYSTIAEFVME